MQGEPISRASLRSTAQLAPTTVQGRSGAVLQRSVEWLIWK